MFVSSNLTRTTFSPADQRLANYSKHDVGSMPDSDAWGSTGAGGLPLKQAVTVRIRLPEFVVFERLLGEHHSKVILKTLNNKKVAAWNLSRKGAKAQRLLIH